MQSHDRRSAYESTRHLPMILTIYEHPQRMIASIIQHQAYK